jgi:hypothetical protein
MEPNLTNTKVHSREQATSPNSEPASPRPHTLFIYDTF